MKKLWQKVKEFLDSRGFQEIRETGALHFFGCFVIVTGLHHFGIGTPAAAAVAMAVGFVKEAIDYFRGRGWDWYDVGMNALGTFVGFIFNWPSPW